MYGKKVLAVLLIAAYMSSNAAAIGLGLAPSKIDVSNALKGGEYERTLMIYNTNPDEGLFDVSIDGAIQNWTTFHDPADKSDVKQMRIAGNSQKSVVAKFSVPADAANGKYAGTIYASLLPVKKGVLEGATQSVTVRMPSDVVITVSGEQIVKAEVRSINVNSVEIDYPLRSDVGCYNVGNVVITPKVSVELKKDGTVVRTAVNDNTPVKPQELKTVSAEISTTDLNLGNYIVTVKAFLNNELLKQEDVNVSILKRGTLSVEGKIAGALVAPSSINLGVVYSVSIPFQNTGQMDVKAKLSGEVFNQAGEMIDTIDGDSVLVRAGETAALSAYYKPAKDGEYNIKYKIVYEGKDIPLDSVKLLVKPAAPETNPTVTNVANNGITATTAPEAANPVQANPSDDSLLMIVGGVAVVLMIALIVLRSRKSKKKE